MGNTRRIRIGNQSAFSASTVTQPFEYAVAEGFDAFEWFPDKKESGAGWAESDISKEQRAFIKKTALDHDICLSVHAPWQANPLRPESRDIFLKDIEFAQDIGASLINIHLYTDEGIASYVQAIVPLIKDLAKAGVKLSIENTPITRPQDFNELFRQLIDLGSTDMAHVGMCLDLGHANLCEATLNNYLKFIDLLDSRVPIIHIHLHENYGDYDSHLPLFTGPAGKDDSGIKGFIERMGRRNFSGCVIFEQWPEPPDLLNDARNRLLKMISISERPAIEPDMASGNDLVNMIAKADRKCRSWREKLGWIDRLLSDDTFELNTEQLIYLAIYLRFIGTGEIPCTEDGRHFRPSHHARMAHHIQDRLSKITTPENVFIIRKIYPWLPSFTSRFARKEPLTRIRDIAHRNDIPKELKKEIKNTLQNKLHRCAGPEDLATSAALFKRITAPDAGYSPDFVKEFKEFHKELKEFFNASSLEEQLETMLREGGAHNSHTLELVHKFLEAKEKAHTPDELVTSFELLTMLRSQFSEKLKGETGSKGQKLQMTDIGLEDFSFVLLSQLINLFDVLGKEINWSPALRCLELAIENLRLSGFDTKECQAIESELEAWRRDFRPQDREHLIRLKSTIDRCRRLAEVYCNRILALFPEKVERLGQALGVDRHKIKIFCEVDIRSHLVFQVSKLIALLLKGIRRLAALPPWDVIVPGKTSGRLVEAACLDDLPGPFDKAIVVLMEKVEGDEEIPAGVVGLIVAHETPLLSHLAVRARQGEIVFIVCEDADRYAELKNSLGKQLVLDVSAEEVNLEFPSGPEQEGITERKRKVRQKRAQVPDVLLCPDRKLLPLDQVRPATGGSKADAARRLEELSQIEEAGFVTSPGVVVPFGVMEESLNKASVLEQEYRMLVSRLNELPQSDFFEVLRKLQGIIGQLDVPDEIVSGVMEKFPRDERLMVRSSANCEDLEGLSGAGLYDSLANVSPPEVAQAVRKVWSSLWTRRAALSRKKLDIPHDRAHMAVLIQQMVVPEISFVMHTVNPVAQHRDEVYVELAVGLGEALTSGKILGVPYRMVCNKHTGSVCMLAFASFSYAIWPGYSENLIQKTVDYSRTGLSKDKVFRNRLGGHLGAIGRFVEDSAGMPQDIEGLVLKDKIYLVQSRPQQGVF
jgi:phosphoglucan,water dikinase